jgi:hypothetical protein
MLDIYTNTRPTLHRVKQSKQQTRQEGIGLSSN